MNVLSDFILFVNKLVDKKDDPTALQDNMKKLPGFALANQHCYFSTLTQKVAEMSGKTTLADLAKPGSPPETDKKQPTEQKTAAAKETKPAKKASTAKTATAAKTTSTKKTVKKQ
jgi:hypothetical protein